MEQHIQTDNVHEGTNQQGKKKELEISISYFSSLSQQFEFL